MYPIVKLVLCKSLLSVAEVSLICICFDSKILSIDTNSEVKLSQVINSVSDFFWLCQRCTSRSLDNFPLLSADKLDCSSSASSNKSHLLFAASPSTISAPHGAVCSVMQFIQCVRALPLRRLLHYYWTPAGPASVESHFKMSTCQVPAQSYLLSSPGKHQSQSRGERQINSLQLQLPLLLFYTKFYTPASWPNITFLIIAPSRGGWASKVTSVRAEDSRLPVTLNSLNQSQTFKQIARVHVCCSTQFRLSVIALLGL